MKNKYISLSEAAKQCAYSQEYLSLRARQGKLKSKKIGRNWVTTVEWLKDYISKMEEYNNGANGRNGVNWRKAKPWPEQWSKAMAVPPHDLPIGEPVLIFEKPQVAGMTLQKIALASAMVALVMLMGTAGFLSVAIGPDYVASVFGDYQEWITNQLYTASIAMVSVAFDVAQGRAQLDVDVFAQWFAKTAKTVKDDLQFAFNSIGERLGFFAKAPQEKPLAIQDTGELSQKTDQLEESIIGDIQQRFGEFREEVGLAQDHKKSEGLVVVPSGEKDEEVREKLKLAFSDEVVIEPKDETSGIIRPIFRKMAEQAYLYMMVPLKN